MLVVYGVKRMFVTFPPLKEHRLCIDFDPAPNRAAISRLHTAQDANNWRELTFDRTKIRC